MGTYSISERHVMAAMTRGADGTRAMLITYNRYLGVHLYPVRVSLWCQTGHCALARILGSCTVVEPLEKLRRLDECVKLVKVGFSLVTGTKE
jgi:hypothetical protein